MLIYIGLYRMGVCNYVVGVDNYIVGCIEWEYVTM